MLYAYLSGKHPRLPEEELKALVELSGSEYKPLLRLDQLVLFNADVVNISAYAKRAAYVKEVGEVLAYGGRCEVEELLAKALRSLELRGLRSFKLELTSIKVEPCCSPAELLRGLTKLSIRPSLSSENTVRVLISEGIAIVGLAVGRRDLGNVKLRSPPNRPFWRSGELDIRLSRAMVNLSRLPYGGTFLDAFCGTGTLALEAMLAGGSKALCVDIDGSMAYGSKINFSWAGLDSLSLIANAGRLPLKEGSVDSIASDPPYGRSTRVVGESYGDLVEGFLRESARVLKSGSYVAYAGPVDLAPYKYAVEQGFDLIARIDQYVHSGLTRQIVVAKKAT
ncbi:RsmD family RNA methyltransferase [Acidilobus sp.]|jgi:tRNA (guanine10-N2)-dimethyltransferase|uniref:RsmD family RNA methyltransferase n=1 Tax=Acidilobus sp. TaxID=1872109 RepID=UPI003D02BA09